MGSGSSTMENILETFVASLESEVARLHENKESLHNALHDPDRLPDAKISKLATVALDRLKELQLLLEPGHTVLADHFFGYTDTKCLVAAVELNISDSLKSGPQTLESLAESCNARADRLGQILRTLTNNGVFAYDPFTKIYSNNHVSTSLQSDHWTQWRSWANTYGNEFYDMARGIPASVRADSTRTPSQINYDTDDSMFKYFAERGWIEKFHKTLSAGATAQAPGIMEDYPWEEVADATVFDIGGGAGGLIASLLGKYKAMTGAIFDLPGVIAQAKESFHGPKGLYVEFKDRIPEENLIAGDFFVEVPSSEVYVMKWVLHDWDDEKAASVLKNVRKAVKKTDRSRLVILESVLQDGRSGRISRYADLNMMVAVGGKERDEEEWKSLAEASGWELKKIYSLRNAWPSAIEFVPNWEYVEAKKDKQNVNVKAEEAVTNEAGPAPENIAKHVEQKEEILPDTTPAPEAQVKQPTKSAVLTTEPKSEATAPGMPPLEKTITEDSSAPIFTPPESTEGDSNLEESGKSQSSVAKEAVEEPIADTPTLSNAAEEPGKEEQVPNDAVLTEKRTEQKLVDHPPAKEFFMEASTRESLATEQASPVPQTTEEAVEPLKNHVPEAPDHITASMRFLEPWDSSRGTPYIRINPCPGYDRMNFNWQDYSVPITNARPNMNDFDLDFHGFTYTNDEISPALIDALRKNEPDTIRSLYYPHIIELAKKLTGGKRVIIFDHTQRKRRLDLEDTKNDDGKEQPATMVHCDQTPESAIRRLSENLHLWEDVKTVLKGRVRMINIWRPLTSPVQDWPLATMDYHTTKPDAMHACNLLKETFERRGQTATFTHSEGQKWYYLDQQKSSEVTAIKIWDNADGVSKFCAHAAFNDVTAPPDATPRESVEVRCLVLDEPEGGGLRNVRAASRWNANHLGDFISRSKRVQIVNIATY
ncbi:O-methyltransferase-domain-containing protein [Clohesyomyces aquaticus]|uniref:O-methyltransferase-domain-containing protein n=1 Tax=Clohesyomyces aquaticus TaxID=1231657 RepID=A0A1Y1ZWL5_9PLEO|nr:O-methyltransferase-domain-containing protein [Clohesyomyces aquaticus]